MNITFEEAKKMEGTVMGPWRVGTDLFGGVHVYDEGGDRLTNDRMNGNEGWDETARLIAAAPDMLRALRETRHHADDSYGFMVDVCAAIAKATGEAG